MKINKLAILEAVQKYGDLAFIQGYRGSEQGIAIDARSKLAGMREAQNRLDAFMDVLKIVDAQDDSLIFEPLDLAGCTQLKIESVGKLLCMPLIKFESCAISSSN
jgi:hypothetical protein